MSDGLATASMEKKNRKKSKKLGRGINLQHEFATKEGAKLIFWSFSFFLVSFTDLKNKRNRIEQL